MSIPQNNFMLGISISLFVIILFSYVISVISAMLTNKNDWPYYKLTHKKLHELDYVADDKKGILYLNVPKHQNIPKEKSKSDIVIHPVGYIKLYGGQNYLEDNFLKYFDPYTWYWSTRIKKRAYQILNNKS